MLILSQRLVLSYDNPSTKVLHERLADVAALMLLLAAGVRGLRTGVGLDLQSTRRFSQPTRI